MRLLVLLALVCLLGAGLASAQTAFERVPPPLAHSKRVANPLPDGAVAMKGAELRAFVQDRVIISDWGSALLGDELIEIEVVGGMSEQVETFGPGAAWWRAAHNGDLSGTFRFNHGEVCVLWDGLEDCRTFFTSPTGQTFSQLTQLRGVEVPPAEREAREFRSEPISAEETATIVSESLLPGPMVITPLPAQGRVMGDSEVRRFLRDRILLTAFPEFENMRIDMADGRTTDIELFHRGGKWRRPGHYVTWTVGKYRVNRGELCVQYQDHVGLHETCRRFFRTPDGTVYTRQTLNDQGRLQPNEVPVLRAWTEPFSWLKENAPYGIDYGE